MIYPRMKRFFHTLKFQIGAALLSLIGLFFYFSMHTYGMLGEQRAHGALLKLASELQVTAQHMAMQAMNYKDNAPTDQASYSRDLQLYYQDLMVNTQQFGSVCQAFSSGNFSNKITFPHKSMMPTLSDETMDAAHALEEYWNSYLQKLREQLGAQDMPRLALAAEHIVDHNIQLTEKTQGLLESLDKDIQNREDQMNIMVRISFVVAIVLSGGIMLWFYLQVLKPLGNSVRGFRKVSTGDFGHRIKVSADNEIGWMAQTFNQLAGRLDTLFRLTTHLQEGSDLDETLHFVSKAFPELLPLDWVGVLFLSSDEQIQLEKAYSDGQPENLGILRFPLRDTILAQCLKSGEPIHIPDVKEVSLLNPSYRFLHLLADRDRRDAIFLPVTTQSPIPGVLVFAVRQAHSYKREHLELLSNLALVITLSFGRTLKLAEHARLAAIGQFASGIAHEIRTPLATVSMALDYFRTADLSESANKRAQLASSEMARMNRLLEDMLLYAKPLRLKNEPLQLDRMLENIVDNPGQKAADRKINLALHLPQNLPLINGDRDRLIQIFLNLINNAIEASPDNSTVDISLRIQDPGDIIQIKVHNEGEAIPEKNLEHLFEPFYTTKVTGTGLGLAIVRRLVEAHGGSIAVSSDADSGTEFEVRLPGSS